MAETKGFADQDDMLVAIGRSWGWVLAFGIATLILGIIVTIHPKNSVYAVAVCSPSG